MSLLVDEDILGSHIPDLRVDLLEVVGSSDQGVKQVPDLGFLEVPLHSLPVAQFLGEDVRVVVVVYFHGARGPADGPARVLVGLGSQDHLVVDVGDLVQPALPLLVIGFMLDGYQGSHKLVALQKLGVLEFGVVNAQSLVLDFGLRGRRAHAVR